MLSVEQVERHHRQSIVGTCLWGHTDEVWEASSHTILAACYLQDAAVYQRMNEVVS